MAMRPQMSYEELQSVVHDYFIDRNRTPAQTKEDLLAIADEARMLADTIEIEKDIGD